MRRSVFLGLCALLAPLAPLTAADAYVPLAANLSLGAATYRTLLITTNTGGSPADFSVTFLASGTNGTAGAPQPSHFTLPAGATLRLYSQVPAASRGMLALSGSSAIVVSARVEALGSSGNVLASAQVPVFPARDAHGAGERAVLSGLEQDAAGASTDFGLMNLAGSVAHCTIDAYRAGGKRIAATVNLTLPPLSNNDFRNALATLGAASIKDARFDVSCDQAFGTYAFVYRAGGPETVVLEPAARLDSDLKPDVVGGVTFSLPGQFANGTTFASYDLPLLGGTAYGHARIEFDFQIDKWHQLFPNNPNFHNVASFRRSATKRADRLLYWGLILKGSGDFRTLLDMGVAPGQSEGTTLKSGKGPWKERTTYHVVLDYDAQAGTIAFEAYQGGALVQRMTGPINNAEITNLPDKVVRVDFSSAGVGDFAYFPTIGWKYSNLSVKLTPRSQP
jgi:hypothetical protein